MTKLIVLATHTTDKLKHAENIKDMHKHSIMYELGTISAGIQERFHRMLKLYREYAYQKNFQSIKYTLEQNLRAYHVMQGEYNEIRLERIMFLEIKKKHESTTTIELRLLFTTSPPTKKPPRYRRKWEPMEEDRFKNYPVLDDLK